MKCQVLDITRTVSRIGCGLPTGIDRVERAYIKEFLKRFPNAMYLAKLTQTYVLIDATTMQKFVDAGFGQLLKNRIGPNDLVRLKLPLMQRRARSFIRYQAKRKFQLSSMNKTLLDYFPKGYEYTNVGHSNLSENFLLSLKPAGCLHIRVMIHDMIPLDFPQYCRGKTPASFRAKMKAVAAVSDMVICNSEYTKSRVEYYFEKWPNKASLLVAYLGTEKQFTKKPVEKRSSVSFIILGTIEPRKNHLLLLDVWEELSKKLPVHEIPTLHIVGKRGWENDAFFERLDNFSMLGKIVKEHNTLNDEELNSLMGSASGLLFPSFVEGYGLPALEAAAAALPIICSNIPIFKELLGAGACIVPIDDHMLWVKKILEITKNNSKIATVEINNTPNITIPRWPAHFRHIFGE